MDDLELTYVDFFSIGNCCRMLQTPEYSESNIIDLLRAWVRINNSLILLATCLVLLHSSLRRRIFLSSDTSSFAEDGIGGYSCFFIELNFNFFLGGPSSSQCFLLTFCARVYINHFHELWKYQIHAYIIKETIQLHIPLSFHHLKIEISDANF